MTSATAYPDADCVRALLAESGVSIATVEPLGAGRTTITYRADKHWIVQFPIFDAAVRAARIQAQLMPLVQACVPFAVPVPEILGYYNSRPVMYYRMVPGRALRAGDHWRALSPILRALHNVSTEQARAVLNVAGTAEEWHRGYVRFRTALDASVSPLLPNELQRRMATEYDQFVTEAVDFAPTFIHADLADEHIMIDPATRLPSGLIDFDWAGIGDPALDYVGLLTALGPEAVNHLSHAAGETLSWRRLLFYWWLNPCYALVYAGPYLDEETRQYSVNTLCARLESLPALRAQTATSR